jgi:hypothetical protein
LRCQRPAIHHRILDSECIKRRPGAHIALFEPWNEIPPLTTDVLAARKFVPVRMGKMRKARSRASVEVSTMTTRTTTTIVRFSAPFMLPGFDAVQPAGDYRVDQDEELLEVSSRLAWRRVGAFVRLPAIGIDGQTHQMAPIDPADLDAALEKDHQQS